MCISYLHIPSNHHSWLIHHFAYFLIIVYPKKNLYKIYGEGIPQVALRM